jgi:mono/diheme cytochrome c family protein
MTRATLVAALVAGGALAACAAPSQQQEGEASKQRESGQATFAMHCASCHGVSGEGDGPAGTALTQKPADLTRIAARRGGIFPEAAVLRIIDGRDPIVAHGTREMPVWGHHFGTGHLPGPDAESAARGEALMLVQYLASIQKSEPKPAE